jgi:hypothetical protein
MNLADGEYDSELKENVDRYINAKDIYFQQCSCFIYLGQIKKTDSSEVGWVGRHFFNFRNFLKF